MVARKEVTRSGCSGPSATDRPPNTTVEAIPPPALHSIVGVEMAPMEKLGRPGAAAAPKRRRRGPPGERDRHRQEHEHLKSVAQVRGEPVGHGEFHRRHVGGEAREQVARGGAGEVRGRQAEQLLVQAQAQVGDHPLAEHAHREELAEVGAAAHQRDAEDEQRQRAQQRCAVEPGGIEGRQRAAQRARGQLAALEDELEERPDQPGEEAGGEREQHHPRERAGDQGTVRPPRLEQAAIGAHSARTLPQQGAAGEAHFFRPPPGYEGAMTELAGTSVRRDSLAALRLPDVRRYAAGRLLSTFAAQMQAIAVGWHLYERTGSAWALGFTGLVEVVPALVLALPAGHVADRFDRRKVSIAAQVLLSAVAAGLALVSFFAGPVWLIYVLLFCSGAGVGFSSPASNALFAQLVPPEHFANANAWLSSG